MKKNFFLKAVSVIFAVLLCLSFVGCNTQSESAYQITVLSNGYGNTNTVTSAQAGDRVKVDVSSQKGYQPYAVYVNGTPIQGNEFIMPEGDVVVSVSYVNLAANSYAVNIANSEDGYTVSDLTSAEAGDTVTLTSYPSYNRQLAYYCVDGIKIDGNTFTMPAANVTVTAEYTQPIASDAVALSVVATRFEATSYWSARYLERGVEVKAVVEDPILYHSYKLQSNYAYHDNIEFIVGETGAAELTSKHMKLLVASDGNHYLQYYNNGWVSTGANGLSVQADYCYIWTHGFVGYEVTAVIPYDRFGLTYETALGNLSICPAMRNTAAYFHTTWASYNGQGCSWENPHTYLSITEDGKLQAAVTAADYLVAGDGVLSALEGYTLKSLYRRGTYTNVKSSSTLSWWTENMEEIAKYNPQHVFFSCGTNDLMEKSVLGAFSDMCTFLATFKQEVGCYLTVVSAIPYISDKCDPAAVAAFNGMMKDYLAEQDGITYIDLCSLVYKDGVLNEGLYGSNNGLSEMGNMLLNKLVVQTYGEYTEPGNEQWGDIGENITMGNWIATSDLLSLSTAGISHIYNKQFSGTDFYVSTKITVGALYNNDSYPKFGLSVIGKETSYYFYIVADGLTKQYANVVARPYSGYAWPSDDVYVKDLAYTYGQFAHFEIVKLGTTVKFTLNDVVVYQGSITDFGEGDLTLGVFSFNLGLQVKEWSVTTDLSKIEEALK